MNRPPIGLATARSAPTLHVAEQIGFYVLAGVLLPAAVWAALRGVPLDEPHMLGMLLQLQMANLACWYVLGRLRTYARARLLSYVLPVNLALFGIVFAINGMWRLDFSFTLFLTSLFATLGISYLVTTRIRHSNPRLRHYIVPGGSIGTYLAEHGFEPLASEQQLEALILVEQVSGSIVADLHHDHSPEWERLLAKAALKGIPVYHYRLIEEALTGEVRINHLRENELGSLIPNLPYRYAKRAIDVAGVVILAPFLLPAIGLLALLIKMDSPGSAFYFHERVGFRGENFRMVKLRTMRERVTPVDMELRIEDAKTRDNDDRITGAGRFLRKTRLDELPQAWNVLTGDMSWIGPRPEARDLAEWYEGEIPFYSYRHIVRPGITGWAQVNQGHVADVEEVKTKLRLDFYYVKNLSLWLDILIALKTLRVIVRGIGAK
ncbi:sugar transferase [Altererythrobacter sp. Z27]|uniref:sugar transferase n=1 Tax=Altererythrobacter sp. Z27 TaxID=3461147 RepID=UPI004043B350